MVSKRLPDAIINPLAFVNDARLEIGATLKKSVPLEEGIMCLRLIPLLKPDEKSLPNEQVMKRCRSLAKLARVKLAGQRHAERVLYHHPEKIPEKWQSSTLLFPGTEWLAGKKDCLIIPGAFWVKKKNEWIFTFYPLKTGESLDSGFKIVCVAKN